MTFLGIDLGGSKMKLLAQTENQIIEHKVTTGPNCGPQQICDEIRAFVNHNHLEIHGIGLAVPGIVQNGAVVACDVLPLIQGWIPEQSLADFGHIALFNDAEAGFIEASKDAAPDTTMALIMVGTAIGTSLMGHGQLIKGANGWAGEFGYFPIMIGDQIQRLDELAGGMYIEQKLGLSPQDIHLQIQAQNPTVLQVIQDSGRYLGIGIAGLINLLNPHQIVLGGGTLEYPNYFESALQAAQKWALPDLWNNCKIEKTTAGENIVALGALRGLRQNLS